MVSRLAASSQIGGESPRQHYVRVWQDRGRQAAAQGRALAKVRGAKRVQTWRICCCMCVAIGSLVALSRCHEAELANGLTPLLAMTQTQEEPQEEQEAQARARGRCRQGCQGRARVRAGQSER